MTVYSLAFPPNGMSFAFDVPHVHPPDMQTGHSARCVGGRANGDHRVAFSLDSSKIALVTPRLFVYGIYGTYHNSRRYSVHYRPMAFSSSLTRLMAQYGYVIRERNSPSGIHSNAKTGNCDMLFFPQTVHESVGQTRERSTSGTHR